jgi:hypothetical protein
MDLMEIAGVYEGVDWTSLPQGRDRSWASVNTVHTHTRDNSDPPYVETEHVLHVGME